MSGVHASGARRPRSLARAWLRAIKFLSVIALVGEASGYQRILRETPRERLSLRNSSPPSFSLGRCPSGFIGSRLGAWFGVRETKRPSVMGPCINHAVCECLNPGVPEELRHRNPSDTGRLIAAIGVTNGSCRSSPPEIEGAFWCSAGGIDASRSDWGPFRRRLDRALPEL
ncbi:MAG: hypothetical protein M2R45_01469 [Verrucomicrobia subdivision 3 bacterium]|nr:hypothetical protein [Limisphaerales bacterium]